MKKKIILGSVLLVLFIVLGWISTHGYIEIVPESTNSIDYTLIGPAAGKSTNFKASGSIKKLIKKGQYQLLAQHAETSYYAITRAGGFLGKTTVNTKLEPEKARKFIGDNPGNCMYYFEPVLATDLCGDVDGDVYSHLNFHIPATAQQPTYTLKKRGSIDGVIEGVITTNQGTLAILRSLNGDGHAGYIVNKDLSVAKTIQMSGLDKNKTYSLQPYKEGFIVYDKSLSPILYYASLEAKPLVINVTRPKDNMQQPFAVKTQGDLLITEYSDDLEDLASASGSEAIIKKPAKKTNVTIVVSNNDQSQEYSFKKRLSSFGLCGAGKMCLLDTKQNLDVYDITDKKPRLLFTTSSVDHLDISKNGLAVISNAHGLLGLNVDTQEGFLQYSFGDYASCAAQVTAKGYILCVKNNNGKTRALLVDAETNNTDSIDKKITQLSKQPDIKTVSIYDKYLFISPILGSVSYQPSTKSFGYDPAVTAGVNGRIKQAVDVAGIDRKTYKVINLFDN